MSCERSFATGACLRAVLLEIRSTSTNTSRATVRHEYQAARHFNRAIPQAWVFICTNIPPEPGKPKYLVKYHSLIEQRLRHA